MKKMIVGAALLLVSGQLVADHDPIAGMSAGKKWETQQAGNSVSSAARASRASKERAREAAARGDRTIYGNSGDSSSARADSARSSRASSVGSDTSDVDVSALVSQWGSMIGSRHAAKQAREARGDARTELSKWRDSMIGRSGDWTHDAEDPRIKDLKRMLKFYKSRPVSYFNTSAPEGYVLPGDRFVDARALDDFSMTTPGGDMRLEQIRRKLGPAGMKRLADTILGKYAAFKSKVRKRQEYFQHLGASADVAADLAKAEARMKARGELGGDPGEVPADVRREIEAKKAERARIAAEHKRFRESRTGRILGAAGSGFMRAGQAVEDAGAAIANSAAGQEVARSARSAASTLGRWGRSAWNWGSKAVSDVRNIGSVADDVTFG